MENVNVLVNQKQKVDLIESLTRAYSFLYQTVKERKIRELMEKIKMEETNGKHQRV